MRLGTRGPIRPAASAQVYAYFSSHPWTVAPMNASEPAMDTFLVLTGFLAAMNLIPALEASASPGAVLGRRAGPQLRAHALSPFPCCCWSQSSVILHSTPFSCTDTSVNGLPARLRMKRNVVCILATTSICVLGTQVLYAAVVAHPAGLLQRAHTGALFGHATATPAGRVPGGQVRLRTAVTPVQAQGLGLQP